MSMTATYSPDDNKLRLYSVARLDPETYARVRAAGFIWAPKQDLFVAPTWSPQREDLLIELCGEIDDEDTSLTERAEDRAGRFENYSDRRAADADRAHAAVHAITSGIPLGQPILIGHHSERHARRDAAKIENGMRRAVRMWETSTYWQQRAEGAISHAKYKERPDVRARRIKGIEADKRKSEKYIADAERAIAAWEAPGLTWVRARSITNYSHISASFPVAEYPRSPICADCDRPWSAATADATCGAIRKFRNDEGEIREVACTGRQKPASTYEGSMGLWSALEGIITPEQARDMSIAAHRRTIAANARWITHYTNRLTYERAMLAESIGVQDVADRWPNIEPGGRVLVGTEWCTVIRVNRSGGKVGSLTTNRRYVSKVSIEEVSDYRAPDASEIAAVKRAVKQLPLCNYPGEGFRHMTTAAYKVRFVAGIRDAGKGIHEDRPYLTPQGGAKLYAPHRLRCAYTGGSGNDCHNPVGVYLTDAKTKYPMPADEAAAVAQAEEQQDAPTITAPEIDVQAHIEQTERRAAARSARRTSASASPFAAMKEALREGVKVVAAPALFPTPRELAARVVDLAELEPGQRVLEPSAGTGSLLTAIRETGVDVTSTAIEIDARLVQMLRARFDDVRRADFLACGEDLGTFDRVVMNPPFEHGTDIEHIRHAITFLRPGGKLVAICANGPRQRAALMPLADEWIDLPANSFATSGTSVNVALISITT